MNSVPPTQDGRIWDWPTDGGVEALPEYFREIPKDRLFDQVEYVDTRFGVRRDDDQGRYALLAS